MSSKVEKEIRRIRKQMPEEWFDGLEREEYVAPDVRQVMFHALDDPDVPPKDKQEIRSLLEAGYLDRTEMVVDEEKAKRIEEHYQKEIDRAIEEGRLPHPKDDKGYQRFMKKLKKHAKPNS